MTMYLYSAICVNFLFNRFNNAGIPSQKSSDCSCGIFHWIPDPHPRIGNLQQELDNSVAVQTDFVRLSQSLQMELEKIRQSEKEVSQNVYALHLLGELWIGLNERIGSRSVIVQWITHKARKCRHADCWPHLFGTDLFSYQQININA